MIDNINISSSIDNMDNYMNRVGFDFKRIISTNTGAIEPRATYQHHSKGFTLRVNENNQLKFQCCLPKFLNESNSIDLSYRELKDVIFQIGEMLQIAPSLLHIRSFEFGLNIPINYTFDSMGMKDNAICYKTHPLSDIEAGARMISIGKKYKSQEYEIKIYSKTKQMNLSDEIIRFETRVKKMHYLPKYRFETIDSLLVKDNLQFLRDKLIANIDNTLILDTSVPTPKLLPKEQLLYLNWQSSIYRNNLTRSDKRKFHREKEQILYLMDEYGANNLRESFRSKVIDKWNVLIES